MYTPSMFVYAVLGVIYTKKLVHVYLKFKCVTNVFVSVCYVSMYVCVFCILFLCLCVCAHLLYVCVSVFFVFTCMCES